MTSAARKVLSRRYALAKFYNAGEEFVYQLLSARQQQAQTAQKQAASFSEQLSVAVEKFKETYNQQLTSVMYLAGNAMLPTLNKKANEDKHALEKLVVRLIPRPSPRSVHVGDVVALNSPLAHTPAALSPQNVMIRRVAAAEGTEMLSDQEEDQPFEIPKGHCWVLADNPDLKPPEVIDSRTFGFVPYSNILGRVVYAASSATEHGPVLNNAISMAADQPIVEEEVDLEKLFPPANSSK